MSEPEFLALEDVLLIHDEQLVAYGGIHGIRDQGLLESAVMTAQASFGGEYLHSEFVRNGGGLRISYCRKSAFS